MTKANKTSFDINDTVDEGWLQFCGFVERRGSVGRWISQNILQRLTIEAPVVILFCALCVMVFILDATIAPGLCAFLGVQDTLQVFSPLQYLRLVSHVFAHSGLDHLRGNMTNLLLVGPSAEHVFGSEELFIVFFLVAVTSALAHILVGGARTYQLGASGIVFCSILLNSLVAAERGKVPMSFVLTAGLWVTDEVYRFFFSSDGVSHHAHLTGAVVGTAAGYWIHEQRRRKQQQQNGNWYTKSVAFLTKQKKT